jgi:hypothetical protein
MWVGGCARVCACDKLSFAPAEKKITDTPDWVEAPNVKTLNDKTKPPRTTTNAANFNKDETEYWEEMMSS